MQLNDGTYFGDDGPKRPLFLSELISGTLCLILFHLPFLHFVMKCHWQCRRLEKFTSSSSSQGGKMKRRFVYCLPVMCTTSKCVSLWRSTSLCHNASLIKFSWVQTGLANLCSTTCSQLLLFYHILANFFVFLCISVSQSDSSSSANFAAAFFVFVFVWYSLIAHFSVLGFLKKYRSLLLISSRRLAARHDLLFCLHQQSWLMTIRQI